MKKKSNNKKPAAKKASSSATRSSVSASAPKGHLVNKQPQSKQDAAIKHGMFLYTDDAWSLRYFDANDLHCKEREVFA